MSINYPGSVDAFPVPSLPENTSLSSAGTGTRDHTEHHADLGLAVVALQTIAAQKQHDHSGDGTDPTKGIKLAQANTHQSVDTDAAVSSLHHTLGSGAFQAAAGNHVHDYTGPTIINKPFIVCTSLTRPSSPFLGMRIWETDTNCSRAWSQFKGQSSPIWQLLSDGATPVLRAESRTTTQEVRVGERHVTFWTDLLEDWGDEHDDDDDRRFLVISRSSTDIVVTESGHYEINGSICWDPERSFHDHSMIGVEVNGVDIGRKNWEFVRGFSFVPGFSQTNDCGFHWYLNKGDVVRVIAQHNATEHSSFLWFDDDHLNEHTRQVSHIEVIFIKP